MNGYALHWTPEKPLATLWKMEMQYYGKTICNFREKVLATNSMENVPDPNEPGSPEEFVLIDEQDAPLGTYTKHRQDTGCHLYLDAELKPLGARQVPKTGDEIPVLPIALIGIASLGTALYLVRHRKKQYN